MEEIDLNENDRKLLALCNNHPLPINYISRRLNLTPASISIRVQKLKEAGLVVTKSKGRGTKTYVRTKKAINVNFFKVELLKKLKEAPNSEMGFEEFCQLAPFDPLDKNSYDRSMAFNSIMYSYPPLIKKKFYLTPEGEKFLKEKAK